MRTFSMQLNDERPRDRHFHHDHLNHGVCGHVRLTAVSATPLILHNHSINILVPPAGFCYNRSKLRPAAL